MLPSILRQGKRIKSQRDQTQSLAIAAAAGRGQRLRSESKYVMALPSTTTSSSYYFRDGVLRDSSPVLATCFNGNPDLIVCNPRGYHKVFG